MTPRASTLLVSLVLVAAPLAASVLAGMRPQTPPPVTAATRLHYYELGKRQCGHTIKHIEAQAPQGQLLGFQIAIEVAGYPKEYRSAVAAGCQAASG
jgi:hypothetical protein